MRDSTPWPYSHDLIGRGQVSRRCEITIVRQDLLTAMAPLFDAFRLSNGWDGHRMSSTICQQPCVERSIFLPFLLHNRLSFSTLQNSLSSDHSTMEFGIFEDQTIFVTGGSGFLGTALVAKIILFTQCPSLVLLCRGGPR